MHLDEEEIQRLLDAEHASTLSKRATDHLAACADCRSRVERAEGDETWVAERLQCLDHEPRELSARELIAGRSARVRSRIAAGFILVAVLGGVAYAAPGSPLPRLVGRVLELISTSQPPPSLSPPPSPRPAPVTPPGEVAQVGIAVDPGKRFTVDVIGPDGAGTALVSLTDGPELVVRARGGTTMFTSDVERLRVGHTGKPATLEIQVPRGAPVVQLRWGERAFWRKEGSRITSDVAADQDGRYRFMLSGER